MEEDHQGRITKEGRGNERKVKKGRENNQGPRKRMVGLKDNRGLRRGS